MLIGRRSDILARNEMGHATYGFDLPFEAPDRVSTRPNLVRRLSFSEHARSFYVDWQRKAADSVADLTMAAARYPDDAKLAELIGELTMKSSEFAAIWAKHPVHDCGHQTREFDHPQVGRMTLTVEICDSRTTRVSVSPWLALSEAQHPSSP